MNVFRDAASFLDNRSARLAGQVSRCKSSGHGGWRTGVMAYWLFKEEPDHYNFADLERDGVTRWDGVTNALARKNLRQVKKGDRIWYYHTGKEKAIVGEMRAVRHAQKDPDSDDPNAVVVEVRPVRRLHQPVSLTQMKQDPLFAGWDLVRLPRLSVMPVSEAQWRRVEELGGGTE
jgi:predicted RNA-binding protein with PUA-like domain